MLKLRCVPEATGFEEPSCLERGHTVTTMRSCCSRLAHRRLVSIGPTRIVRVFPGVENPDLATGMPRSPTKQDDFARSPILVETKAANLRPDWCCTGNTRHFRNRRDRNVHDLVVYPLAKTLLRGYLDTFHNLLSDHALCVGCPGEGGRKLCRCRCRCGTFNHRCQASQARSLGQVLDREHQSLSPSPSLW